MCSAAYGALVDIGVNASLDGYTRPRWSPGVEALPVDCALGGVGVFVAGLPLWTTGLFNARLVASPSVGAFKNVITVAPRDIEVLKQVGVVEIYAFRSHELGRAFNLDLGRRIIRSCA